MGKPKNFLEYMDELERRFVPPEEPEDEDEGYDSPAPGVRWGEDVEDAIAAGRAIGDIIAPVARLALRLFWK